MSKNEKNVVRGLYAGLTIGYFIFGRPVLGTATLALWAAFEIGSKMANKEEK